MVLRGGVVTALFNMGRGVPGQKYQPAQCSKTNRADMSPHLPSYLEIVIYSVDFVIVFIVMSDIRCADCIQRIQCKIWFHESCTDCSGESLATVNF